MATAADAVAYVTSLNRRIRKNVPEFMAKRFAPVYIFNIYPRAHRVMLGSLGEFHIPACEVGQPYSKPCIINGFIADEYDLGDGKGNMSWNPEQGEDVAKDVVGIGSYSEGLSTMTTNRQWWGCFIAAGETPTAEELEAARKKLEQNMKMWLAEGDQLVTQGKRPEATHIEAAVWLKQVRQWSNPVIAMMECPGCGESIKPNIARHTCGAVIDKLKAIELGMIPDDTAPVAKAPLSESAKVVQK